METESSFGSGESALPLTAFLTYKRVSAPATQRMPWPNATPFWIVFVPWRNTLNALGRSPALVRRTWSPESDATPVTKSCAPPVPELLSQPRPGPDAGLKHGQGITLPIPGSQTIAPAGTQ